MSDLISRSALNGIRVVHLTKQIPEWYSLTEEEKNRLIRITRIHKEIISNAPAVDAVPVVLCKDCKHSVGFRWGKDDTGICLYDGSLVGKLAFCSNGKRRDDGDNE